MSAYLKDAIQAVKDKIIAEAATANSEGLAMLGTAIDRIGGRATVLEVVELGDMKKREIADLAAAKVTAIETQMTTAATKLQDLELNASANIAAVAQAKEQEAVANIQAAGVSLTLTDTFDGTTATYDGLGRITSYRARGDRVLSNITYGSDDNIVSWDETYPLTAGGTKTLHYTVTYDAQGGITNILSTVI